MWFFWGIVVPNRLRFTSPDPPSGFIIHRICIARILKKSKIFKTQISQKGRPPEFCHYIGWNQEILSIFLVPNMLMGLLVPVVSVSSEMWITGGQNHLNYLNHLITTTSLCYADSKTIEHLLLECPEEKEPILPDCDPPKILFFLNIPDI